MKKVLNKIWPAGQSLWAAPLIFLFFVWLIFATPYFVQNKAPYPSNHQVNNYSPWSEYKKFWGPVKNSAMPDIIDQIYPWREFVISQLKKSEIPLWNPYTFSGNTHLANYQSAVFHPFNFLFFIFNFTFAWSILILLQPLLAGIFVFLFTRSLSLSKISSLIASVSFMFCGFITVWMGYGTLGYAIIFLPLSLFAIEKYFITKEITYPILLSLTIPLSFFSGHFQTSIYFLSITILYLLYKVLLTKQKNTSIAILLFVFFGILLSMPQLLPSFEAYQNSVRSAFFQKTEIIPWSHLSTIIAPDFFGNPVTRNNPIGHYAEWASFAGVIPFFLFLYAVINLKRSKYIPFFFIVSLFSLMVAFGTFLSDILIRLQIPAISTSAVSRIIVLFSFSVAILSAFGVDFFLKDLRDRKLKKIYLWITISFFILGSISAFAFSPVLDNAVFIVARKNIFLPLILFLIGFILTVVSVLNKKLLILLPVFFLILTSFDMLRFTSKWMPFDSKENVYPSLPITDFLRSIPSHERTIGALGQGAYTTYNLLGVDGYDPIYPKRYGEFLTFANSGELSDPSSKGIKFSYRGKYSQQTLDLLGIKYIVHKIGDDGKVWAFPFDAYEKDRFKVIFNDKKIRIYENTRPSPRVFLTAAFEVEKDDKEILDKVFTKNNFRKIILEKNPIIDAKVDIDAEAKIEKYEPSKIIIKTNSKEDSILFLSDNYYPGWKAWVDGKQIPILRADYTFRSVPVPSGKHIVTFSYEPESFKIGFYLALLGIAGIFVFSIWYFVLSKGRIAKR